MFRFLAGLLLAFVGVHCHAAAATKEMLDVLIVDGTVIDGSGGNRYSADIGIVGDTITAIGPDLDRTYDAKRTIDAGGRVVAPGYIDVHTHAGEAVLGDDRKRRAALNFLYQGITTINIGADGRHSNEYAAERKGQIAKQYEFIDANPFGMNVFILFGHDTLRRAAMGGDVNRFASKAEMQDMGTYVRQYMNEGALGMSLGLEYASGRQSDEEELVYLAKALADYDRRAAIIAHERATGPQHRYYLPSNHDATGLYGARFKKYPGGWDVIDYVKEGIRIAEQSGIVYDFTHIKVTHKSYWGKSAEIIQLINEARARGVKIFAEQIPFTISGNEPMNLKLIPAKYYGRTKYSYAKLKSALAGPATRDRLRRDIAWEIDKSGGAESILIIQSRSHPEWIGKTLHELGRMWELRDPVDVVLKIKELGDDDLQSGARFHSRKTLSEVDVDNFAKQEWMGTVTDGSVLDLKGGFAQPRSFAAFTNKITEMVQKRKAISLEHAIRAGTGLPASMLSIPNRGVLKVGNKADIQVFDPEKLKVNARWTLSGSRAYSDGVYHVLVNGTIALDDGKPTYELAGKSIRNQDIWRD